MERKALVLQSDSILQSLLQEALEKSGVDFIPAKTMVNYKRSSRFGLIFLMLSN